MSTGIFIFKCRKCTAEYDHPDTDDIEVMRLNYRSMMATGDPYRGSIGKPMSFMEAHQCDAITEGIAVCIALIEDEGSGS